MKQIFAFEKEKDFRDFKGIGERLFKGIADYKEYLIHEFSLSDVPKAVVWTSDELATQVFSKVPIAAFTNKDLIYMSPDLDKWREMFLSQLENRNIPAARNFYESFSENHLLVILAHELTHHLDLFPDEFDEREDSIWFEEGMCFYLPRKTLLTEQEFQEISHIESQLVKTFADKYGQHSLDQFGSSSYSESLTSIMFDYWRSYLAVKNLVEKHSGGDIARVFREYEKWHREGRKLSLTAYFKVDEKFFENQ